tara:strand:+ start:1652 stop:2158 length:507 start_codon:yes stop_codon:yes gene_type:complete
MAGVKITDLGTLTTAVDADLLYIVDVSDTSQSPQGTSKQIELGNMFSSGSYTPTVSGVVNAITVTPNSATYIKVGSIVNVSAQIGIQMDAGETTGTFELSLPVASDFASQKNLFGLMQWSNGSGTLAEIVTLDISAETTNNTCIVVIETLTAEALMNYCTLTFQYEVL